MPARPADDAEDLCAPLFGEIDGTHQVDADIALGVAAANREDQQRIRGAESTDLETAGKDRFPPLVIRARRELADVVDRRIERDIAELGKTVVTVAAVAGAA